MRSLESIIKANKEVEPGYHAEKLPDYYAEKVERLKKMYGDGLHENVIHHCTYCLVELTPANIKACDDPLCIHNI